MREQLERRLLWGFGATITVESPDSSSNPRWEKATIANTFLHHFLLLESTRCVLNPSVHLCYIDESNAVPFAGVHPLRVKPLRLPMLHNESNAVPAEVGRPLGLSSHRGSHDGGEQNHDISYTAKQTRAG